MTLKRALLLSVLVLAPLSSRVSAATPSALQNAISAAAGAAAGGTAVTDAGAQQLTAVLQRYFGQKLVGANAFVSVTPEGQGYKLQADIARLPLPKDDTPFSIHADPLVALLTPQADGTWHVTSNGLPTLSMTAPDQTSTLSYDGFTFDGVFDPKIGFFRTATTGSSGMTMQGVSPKATVNVRNTGQSRYTQTTRDAADGSVTTEIAQVITDFDYKMKTTNVGGAADQPAGGVAFEARAPKVSGTTTIANLRPLKMLDLWAFMAAHPTQAMLAADQVQLKGLLVSTLPPAASLTGEVAIQGLTVDTPQGSVGFGELFERLAIGASEAKDGVSLRFRVADMTLPQGLLPPWALGLVPTGFDLDLGVGPVHVNEAMLKLVAAFDLAATPSLSAEQSADILKTFGPPDQIVTTLRPSTITTPLLTLKLQGAGHYDMATAKPVGAIVVTAVGLDHAIDTMANTAKQAIEAGQLLQGLVLAKQLATPEAGGDYSWRIESAPGGGVLVNGKALGGLAGGGKPSAEPGAGPELVVPEPDSKP